MRVSVHTRGGVLGLDRVVLVEDSTGTVAEDGTARRVALDPDQVDLIRQLVGRLVRAPEVPIGPAPDVVDSGWSDIDIADGPAGRSLHVPTGARAPDDVWELLQVVETIAEQ
jgi:hypothetical protein